jgi:hypothetical protein
MLSRRIALAEQEGFATVPIARALSRHLGSLLLDTGDPLATFGDRQFERMEKPLGSMSEPQIQELQTVHDAAESACRELLPDDVVVELVQQTLRDLEVTEQQLLTEGRDEFWHALLRRGSDALLAAEVRRAALSANVPATGAS